MVSWGMWHLRQNLQRKGGRLVTCTGNRCGENRGHQGKREPYGNMEKQWDRNDI